MAVNTLQLGGWFLALLGPHMMAILKARVAAAVIYETIDRVRPFLKKRKVIQTSEVDPEADNQEKLMNCQGRIEFQDVHFKYPTRWESERVRMAAFCNLASLANFKGTARRLFAVLSPAVSRAQKKTREKNDLEYYTFSTKSKFRMLFQGKQSPNWLHLDCRCRGNNSLRWS